MSDDEDAAENGLSVADHVTHAIVAVATGLPSQVQKSFWKAVGLVFTAGAQWPAQVLQGKGRVAAAKADVSVARYETEAADIRSRQKGRELVDKESAKQAARQFATPELASRAVEYHAAHVVRRQERMEGIMEAAVEDIRASPPSEDSKTEIEDDVLETILREGSNRSSEEYKILFARILAGEIRRPGSFSVATIQAVGKLSSETAAIFQRLCNISMQMSVGNRLLISPKAIADPFGQAGQNGLAKFGITYNNLARLSEDGLVRPDFGEQRTLSAAFVEHSAPFEIAGRICWLQLISGTSSQDIIFSGPSFTLAGSELRQVVTMEPQPDYMSGLAKWLKSKGFDLLAETHRVGEQVYGTLVKP